MRCAGLEEQQVWRSTLGAVVQHTRGCTLSPAVIIVGAVAAAAGGQQLAGQREAGLLPEPDQDDGQ